MPSLIQIQRWMQSVITHPDGIYDGILSAPAVAEIPVTPAELEQVVCRSKAVSASDRLQIYGNAYFARLLDCLASEFPAMEYALGEEAFSGFAFGYLLSNPSGSYTLNDLSKDFPGYLRETRPEKEGSEPDWSDFLIDLATLERLYADVFDGPGSEGQPLLQSEELLGIPQEKWPDVRLQTVPCLHLVEFDFPVHEFSTAVRLESEEILFPEAERTRLVVTRRGYVVRRFTVTQEEFLLLEAIQQQQTIGEAIEFTLNQSEMSLKEFAERLPVWFQEWTAADLFQSVSIE